jgi:hypothetical protein
MHGRREFLKVGAGGLAAIAVGGLKLPPIFRSTVDAAVRTIDLTMEAALVEMVDFTAVFMWLFGTPALGPSFPGPVILATQGDSLTINLTNNLDAPHAFQVVGTQIQSPPIGPGQTRTLRAIAPAAGTYLYTDPLNGPVNRVLGLHGAFIVLPASGGTNPGPGTPRTPTVPRRVRRRVNPNRPSPRIVVPRADAGVQASRVITPYSSPTPNVLRLFQDLGNNPHFPGDPWLPPPANRSRIWLFTQVDPVFNAQAEAGQVISPADISQHFLPRYFFISGKTGAFADEDPSIAPEGFIGEPHLIRMLNAGIQIQSPHIHANHVYVLAVNQVVQTNVVNIDTSTVFPMDTVDWLLPFIRPPDIPGPDIPLRDLIPQELATVNRNNIPQSPLMFPMHGHTEIDQTAAGGNYPQGMITKWVIKGDLDKVPFPVPPVL